MYIYITMKVGKQQEYGCPNGQFHYRFWKGKRLERIVEGCQYRTTFKTVCMQIRKNPDGPFLQDHSCTPLFHTHTHKEIQLSYHFYTYIYMYKDMYMYMRLFCFVVHVHSQLLVRPCQNPFPTSLLY